MVLGHLLRPVRVTPRRYHGSSLRHRNICCRSEIRQKNADLTHRVGIAGNRSTLVVTDGWLSDPDALAQGDTMRGNDATVIEISPGRAVPSWLVLGIVLIGQFMVVLDASIVNVAVPHLRGSLGR